MKRTHTILTFILLSTFLNAQEKTVSIDEFIIKVKPINSIENNKICDSADYKRDAVVLEFDVVNDEDKKQFGNKIFAIAICDEVASNGNNSKEIYDLKISETKYYHWEIKIFNEYLLDQNIGKKKFWVRNLSRKKNIYCGPGKI
ncbi:hypothetical protein HYN48_13610 [Flavobacterium magnum]|uniref:DUF4352 domain-containing protein n=1 Tax=Flavobacterium magnum TaxID=2162713 RepID=A0A2S0RHE4_9FLAO|nr:hypothetical protein [Flavobacterium magnum]AWA31035.1 hypothetical protein HYN48_13610 [Flavobacterium magnum]